MTLRLSFKGKILSLVGVSIAGMCVFGAVSFVELRNSIIEGRKAQLVTAVQAAQSIASAYQARAESGTMTAADAKNAARQALRLSRFGLTHSDYFYIYSDQGEAVMHPVKPEWEGHLMIGKVKDANGVDTIQALVSGAAGGKDGAAFVETFFPRPGQKEAQPKLQYVTSVKGWGWVVGSGVYLDELDAEVRGALLRSLAFAAGIVLVIGAIGYLVARSVLRQIGGDPSAALSTMNDVARGNLAAQVDRSTPGSLMDGLGIMIDSLRKTVVQVRLSTDSIATASSQIAAGNHDLSARTEQAASSLQQTAASMNQLTGIVAQTHDSARTANQLAASAMSAAAKGGVVVAQVVHTMEDINTSSRRISDIVGVIDGIAFQTNILALNAAVEAARAGDQGRGFAVVAAEVRSLAQRSATAAKEIKALISASVQGVAAGSQLVAAAGASMQDIVSSVDRVSSVIGAITQAAGEQSAGLGQVNTAVSNLDQMTQQNSALVEQSSAAAESLSEQARLLLQVVHVFQLEAAGAAT